MKRFAFLLVVLVLACAPKPATSPRMGLIFPGNVPGTNTVTTNSIQAGAVTNAKMATMAANTVKARVTQSTGAPEDATTDQLAALLQQSISTVPQVIGTVGLGQSVIVVSPTIDFFAATGTTVAVVPTISASLRVVLTAARVLYVTRTGTVTGVPTGKFGNNAGHDNLSPTVSFVANAAQVSLADAGDVGQLNPLALTGKAATFGAPATATDVLYEITTSATGAGATLTGKIVCIGFFVAFP